MAADNPSIRVERGSIVVLHGVTRVRVAVAIELVVAALDAEGKFPPTYELSAEDVFPDGTVYGDVDMVEHPGRDCALQHMTADFPDACAKLGITPRNPYSPLADDYTGTWAQNALYEIEPEEFVRYALACGVRCDIEPVPASKETPAIEASPVETVELPASDATPAPAVAPESDETPPALIGPNSPLWRRKSEKLSTPWDADELAELLRLYNLLKGRGVRNHTSKLADELHVDPRTIRNHLSAARMADVVSSTGVVFRDGKRST